MSQILTDQQIDDLKAQIATGATSISVDGQSVTIDVASARRLLSDALDEQRVRAGLHRKRPRAATIRVGMT